MSEWRGNRARTAPEGDLAALASAAETIWGDWQSSNRSEAEVRGRQTLWIAGRSVLVLSLASAKPRLE